VLTYQQQHHMLAWLQQQQQQQQLASQSQQPPSTMLVAHLQVLLAQLQLQQCSADDGTAVSKAVWLLLVIEIGN